MVREEMLTFEIKYTLKRLGWDVSRNSHEVNLTSSQSFYLKLKLTSLPHKFFLQSPAGFLNEVEAGMEQGSILLHNIENFVGTSRNPVEISKGNDGG